MEALHDERADAVVLDVVVHAHDVRMVERREQARLGGEPGAGRRVAQERGRQRLMATSRPSRDVPRGEHDGERAATQEAADLVARQGLRELRPLGSAHHRLTRASHTPWIVGQPRDE